MAAGVSLATAELILFAGSLGLLTAGICGLLTANDFNNIHTSLLALGAKDNGAHIKLDTTWLGWDRLTISTTEGQLVVFLVSSLIKSYRAKSHKVVSVRLLHSVISRQASLEKGKASWYAGNAIKGLSSPIKSIFVSP